MVLHCSLAKYKEKPYKGELSLKLTLKVLRHNLHLPDLVKSLFSVSISQRTPCEAFATPPLESFVNLRSVSLADGIALMSALLLASNDNIHKALVPPSLSSASCLDVISMLTMTGIAPFNPN